MKRPSVHVKRARKTAVKSSSREAFGHRKSPPHGRSTSRKAAARISPAPPGFEFGAASLLIPTARERPIPASKMRRGLVEAKRQLDQTLGEVLSTLTGAYEIKEIQLVASFSADGKFMGFGVGGAASMEITICSCEEG